MLRMILDGLTLLLQDISPRARPVPSCANCRYSVPIRDKAHGCAHADEAARRCPGRPLDPILDARACCSCWTPNV